MDLYQVVYDFFHTYIFTSSMPSASWEIGGVTFSLAEWLSNTASVIVLAFLSIVAFRFVVWLTRLVAGMFQFRH